MLVLVLVVAPAAAPAAPAASFRILALVKRTGVNTSQPVGGSRNILLSEVFMKNGCGATVVAMVAVVAVVVVVGGGASGSEAAFSPPVGTVSGGEPLLADVRMAV